MGREIKFSLNHRGFTPFFDSVELQCEVIGNIHENPELLEAQSE
jgi:uncharacterized phage protein (TIGR01671 family)